MIDRREALRRIALVLGGTVIGLPAMLAGDRLRVGIPSLFTASDQALLDEIGETILPATPAAPGARAVGIGAFTIGMVDDCYPPPEHAAFVAGLRSFAERCRRLTGRDFAACAADERTALCNALDREQQAAWLPDHGPEAIPPYFRMFKELTILGYFSSEIGCTRAVRYLEVPGSYDGDRPYRAGDPAWF